METTEWIEALRKRALTIIDFQLNSKVEMLLPMDVYHLTTALEKLSRINNLPFSKPMQLVETKPDGCRKISVEDCHIAEIEHLIQLSGATIRWTHFTPTAEDSRHRIELKHYDSQKVQISDPRFYGETEEDALRSMLMWLYGFVAHKQMGYFHE